MDILGYITIAAQQRAADLFIIAGAPCSMRMDKTIRQLDVSTVLFLYSHALMRRFLKNASSIASFGSRVSILTRITELRLINPVPMG